MKFWASWLMAVAIVIVGVSLISRSMPCTERACKPDWSGDCYCSSKQYMERQSDGVIICRCKADGGR